MATASASCVLMRSTMARRKGPLIVGPTCRSLICTIVKPCSAAGKPSIGTSTSRTRAVRRAPNKPSSTAARASSGTAIALGAVSGGKSNGSVSSSSASRSNVSTSNIENAPRASMPAQLQRSAASRCCARRPKKASGISVADVASSSVSTTPAAMPGKGGTMRQPM
jgi:hypothetical protein